MRSVILVLLAATTAANAQPGLTEPEPERIPVPHVRHHLEEDAPPLWGGGVRVTGLSGVGALPGVNIGAELAGFVRYDEHFAELAVGHWQPQETLVVAETPDRVKLGLDVWSLRGGWASRTMPLRAWLLAESGELAAAHHVSGAIARMVGAVESDHRWLALGGGFGVAWPMAKTARLFGSVELAIPVSRKELMMQTGAPYEPDAAAVRASLGLELGWR